MYVMHYASMLWCWQLYGSWLRLTILTYGWDIAPRTPSISLRFYGWTCRGGGMLDYSIRGPLVPSIS
jgi:hypothetical protein